MVSGTAVVRPCGQRKGPADGAPVFGPSHAAGHRGRGRVRRRGGPPRWASRSPRRRLRRARLRGVPAQRLVRARHPGLGVRAARARSSASRSPRRSRRGSCRSTRWTPPGSPPPPRDLPLLPYLRDVDDRGARPRRWRSRLNGHVVSRPPFAAMYWTAAQQLAHMTVNGASVRTGRPVRARHRLRPGARPARLAAGAVAGAARSRSTLPDGATRTFLEDGDEVVHHGDRPGPDGGRIGLGEVRGVVRPAGPAPRDTAAGPGRRAG